MKTLKDQISGTVAIVASLMTFSLLMNLPTLAQGKKVFVLLYEVGSRNEGIHTIDEGEKQSILLFTSKVDANRYGTELNRLAQLNRIAKWPRASVEEIDLKDMMEFCRIERYVCQQIPKGSQISPPNTFRNDPSWKPSK